MPDTDRLYALSGTHTERWLGEVAGRGMLITDPVVAMLWYLEREREGLFSVTGHVSDDHGASWQALEPSTLLADTEHALVQREHLPGPEGRPGAALLRRALTVEAAVWLDGRIRYVEPDDPFQDQPPTPSLESWQRGGQIWALTLGTVPDEDLCTHLAAQYVAPQPDGPGLLMSGARNTLDALALADAPADTDLPSLMGALRYLAPLNYAMETGQVRARSEQAQQRLLDHLVARHPQTAAVARTHPDVRHPAQQAARAFLLRLATIEPEGEESLVHNAVRSFTDALAAAENVQSSTAAQAAPGDPGPDMVPGYPRVLANDQLAAAQWRQISPTAHRDAELAMNWFANAEIRLAQVSAAADPTLPTSPQEAQARQHRSRVEYELDELNSRHALLMHASVLTDAESAAATATRDVIGTTARDTEAAPGGFTPAAHGAFMTQVNSAEDRIAHILGEQRQLTRDALHRIVPKITSHQGLNQLRAQLIDHSGLGFDAYKRAWNATGDTARTLEDLEARYRSHSGGIGHPPVTIEQVELARTAAKDAETYFAELKTSRPVTMSAVRALDGVAGLKPSAPESISARAARIAEQSRRRTQLESTGAPALPGSTRPLDARQQAALPQAPRASGVRLT
ncbi:hypothetical protein ACWF9B_00310 [Streptomyces sp. NPDC055089]